MCRISNIMDGIENDEIYDESNSDDDVELVDISCSDQMKERFL